ncbi:MAG: PilZ domain-containing protein [Candidatus Xenobia bacterium]
MDFISRFWRSRDDSRRQYERLNSVLRVRLVASDGVIHEVATRDISLEGFRFVTNNALDVNQRVTVLFHLGHHPVQAGGVVKWLKPLDDQAGTLEGGVSFGWMRQSDRERWHAFLKHTKETAASPKRSDRNPESGDAGAIG